MVILKLLLYLFVLVLVVFLAYYTTKLVGKSAGGKQLGKSIHVLERTGIGRDSWLMIVEVQGKVMLLGLSPAGIQQISELEDYVRPTEDGEGDKSFLAMLTKQMEEGQAAFHRQKNDRDK